MALCSAEPRPGAAYVLPGVHTYPQIQAGSPHLLPEAVCWKCQQDMDRFGIHALHCHWGPETINRQNAVRDIFALTARGAGLSPRVEAKKIMEDGQERPADILLPGWPGGQTSAYDVTIVSPYQEKYLAAEAREAGAAIRGAEDNKRRHYTERCQAMGVRFVPLAAHNISGLLQAGCEGDKEGGRSHGQVTGGGRLGYHPPHLPEAQSRHTEG